VTEHRVQEAAVTFAGEQSSVTYDGGVETSESEKKSRKEVGRQSTSLLVAMFATKILSTDSQYTSRSTVTHLSFSFGHAAFAVDD